VMARGCGMSKAVLWPAVAGLTLMVGIIAGQLAPRSIGMSATHSPSVHKALIFLASASPRAVDLMISAGVENERARGRNNRTTEPQNPADAYDMVTAVMEAMTFAFEMS
jgi:hypothetical protein